MPESITVTETVNQVIISDPYVVVGGGGGGSSTLAGLSDVDVSTANGGDVLTYNGTFWIPQAPTGGGVPTSRQIIAGTGLSGGGNLTADRTLTVVYGTTAGTACQGNDARLSDARTPTAHTHVATEISDSTATGRAVLVAVDQAAGRTALGLGTLATQSGTFSGTSSGTNTGDQTITLTGDVTGTGTGTFAVTIANNAVTDAKFRQGAARSIVGVAGAATANVADIVAATDGHVLRRSGTTIGFGQIVGAGITNNAVGNAQFRQGAGLSVVGVTGSATANVADITAGTDGFVLRRAGTALAFGTVATAGITDNAVTYAKVQDVSAASRLLGRGDSGAGDPQEITLGAGLTMTGTTLSASGGGGGAPTTAQYVTLATDGTLTNERVLTGGNAISLTDGGAGSTVTVAVDMVLMTTPTIADVSFADQTLLLDTSAPASQAATVLDILNNPRRRIILHEDFVRQSTPFAWLVLDGSGGTMLFGGADDTTVFGQGGFSTGSGATNSACFRSDTAMLRFGGAEYRFFAKVYDFNTASDGTNTFTLRTGFGDATTGEATDGVFFRYTHSVNGGRWQAVCRSNGTETAADTGIAASAAWKTFSIVVNANGSSAEFAINGTVTNTITTNIPTGAGRATGVLALQIVKSAGTSDRQTYIDFVTVTAEWATLR